MYIADEEPSWEPQTVVGQREKDLRLHWAVRDQRKRDIEDLLEQKIDTSITDNNGDTALSLHAYLSFILHQMSYATLHLLLSASDPWTIRHLYRGEPLLIGNALKHCRWVFIEKCKAKNTKFACLQVIKALERTQLIAFLHDSQRSTITRAKARSLWEPFLLRLVLRYATTTVSSKKSSSSTTALVD